MEFRFTYPDQEEPPAQKMEITLQRRMKRTEVFEKRFELGEVVAALLPGRAFKTEQKALESLQALARKWEGHDPESREPHPITQFLVRRQREVEPWLPSHPEEDGMDWVDGWWDGPTYHVDEAEPLDEDEEFEDEDEEDSIGDVEAA